MSYEDFGLSEKYTATIAAKKRRRWPGKVICAKPNKAARAGQRIL
jgi:hypothetical protein